MPTRATDNPLVIPLLGLLLEQPRHPYALLAQLRQRYPQLAARTGSVYTLLHSLEQAGWVETIPGTENPERRSGGQLRVTSLGTTEFGHRVEDDLEDTGPASNSRFVTALAYIGILDRATAAACLTRRRKRLTERLAHLEHVLKEIPVHPVHMIEVTFTASQLRHDISWIDRFINDIHDPNYDWPHGRH